MINIEIFLVGLLITSTFTGLFTEAFKNLFLELEVTYKPNILAGVVALFVSAIVGFCYVFATGLTFTSPVIVCLIAQMLMSWLCAMVGYDKVIQTITQLKSNQNKN